MVTLAKVRTTLDPAHEEPSPPHTLQSSTTALPPHTPAQSAASSLGPAPSAQHPVVESGPEPPHSPH